MEKKHNCLGCQLSNKHLPIFTVYEDDYVICILDHDPFNNGHTMIALPKYHYIDVDEFDVEISSAVMKASILISKALKLVYKPDGITICQNGGIFNELTHYHMHVVPRYEGKTLQSFIQRPKRNFQIKKLILKK